MCVDYSEISQAYRVYVLDQRKVVDLPRSEENHEARPRNQDAEGHAVLRGTFRES